MSGNSPLLALPYLQPSQAQKHVTHNAALSLLDALVQCRLTEVGAEVPPSAPEEGAVYALGAAPTGDWAGHPGMLAQRAGGGWVFIAPQPGWRAWDLQTGRLLVHEDGDWRSPLQNIGGLGIGTQSDGASRLAVAAAASRFSHDGAGHHLKVNKAAAGETAALLFQSDWTGHAEIGLTGDTAFSVKVSADGNAWDTALRIDPATQQVTLAPAGSVRLTLGEAGLALDVPLTGTAVQQSAEDDTPGRLMLAEHGMLRSAVLGPVSQSGGDPTGAVFESGSNANGDYVRFASGDQICLARPPVDLGSTANHDFTYPATFAGRPVCSISGIDAVDASGLEDTRVFGLDTFWRVQPPGTGAADYQIGLLAVGRWF